MCWHDVLSMTEALVLCRQYCWSTVSFTDTKHIATHTVVHIGLHKSAMQLHWLDDIFTRCKAVVTIRQKVLA